MPINRNAVQPPTITGRIQKNHIHYGSSDFTAQFATASGKSLNYANGPSLLRPHQMTIYSMPYQDKWADENESGVHPQHEVGLFGVENKFVLYKYSDSIMNVCDTSPDYECAEYSTKAETDVDWKGAKWFNSKVPPETGWEEAALNGSTLAPGRTSNKFVSVEIVNNGTGNIYNDSWVDARLYAFDRIEHPYRKMYIPWGEPFYAGFHARNTRRLPYDIDVIIGKEIIPLENIKDKRFIRRTIEFGNQF